MYNNIMKAKKVNIGDVMVCSKCGKRLVNDEPGIQLCCDGGTSVPLKKYVEEVRGETFSSGKYKINGRYAVVGFKDIDPKALTK